MSSLSLSPISNKRKLPHEEELTAENAKKARPQLSYHPHLLKLYEMILKVNQERSAKALAPLTSSTTHITSSTAHIIRVEGERKEREVKEREIKEGQVQLAKTPLPPTERIDLSSFDAELKQVEAEAFTTKDNQALFRRIYLIAIEGDQLELIDLLNHRYPITSLEELSPSDLECHEDFKPLDLRKIFKEAHVATIKKIVSLGFLFRGMGSDIKTQCCFNAVRSSDKESFLYLVEQLKIDNSARTTEGTLINTLLFDNLAMAKEIFSSSPLTLPKFHKGEKHIFFLALQRGRKDVAQFIASKLPLNEPGEIRKNFLKHLISYVRGNNIDVIKFCLACKINLDSTIPSPHPLTSSLLPTFFCKEPHLLACALMEGHEELIPLLSASQDNLNLNMLACLELALKTPSHHHMEQLKSATRKLLALGANINFTQSSKEGNFQYTLMSRSILALIDHDLHGSDKERHHRLAEYILFLTRHGANPIAKIRDVENNLDSNTIKILANLSQTPANLRFIEQLINTIPEASALEILKEAFLLLTPEISPGKFTVVPEQFKPLILRLTSLVFRYFPPTEGLLLQKLSVCINYFFPSKTLPHFEDKPLLLYALENATPIIRSKKITPSLLKLFQCLFRIQSEREDIVSKTYQAHKRTFHITYYNAFYNAIGTSLLSYFPKTIYPISKDKPDSHQKLCLQILFNIDEPANQLKMLQDHKVKFSRQTFADLQDEERWRKEVSKEKLEQVNLILNYTPRIKYDASKLTPPLTETERKEIEAFNLEEQLDMVLNKINFERLCEKQLPKGETEAKAEVKAKEIKDKCNTFLRTKILDRIKNRTAEMGTPPSTIEGKSNPKLGKFYEYITFKLKHFVLYTLKRAASLNEQAKEDLYYSMINELHEIFSLCGGQWEDGLRTSCLRYDKTHPDFGSALYLVLSNIRQEIFRQIVSTQTNLPPGSPVHYSNHISQFYASKYALPSSGERFETDIYVDPPTLKALKELCENEFSFKYNVPLIIKNFLQALSTGDSEGIFNLEIARQSIVESLLRNSEWQLKEYEERAQELFQEACELITNAKEEAGKEEATSTDFEKIWKRFKSSAECCIGEGKSLDIIEGKIFFDVEKYKERFKKIFKEKPLPRRELQKALKDVMRSSREAAYYAEVFDDFTGVIKPKMALKYLRQEGFISRSDSFKI